MKMRSWYVTDVGLRREANEDSILVDEAIGLFVVADGMGGHRGGEIASALAVQAAQKVAREAVKAGTANPFEIINSCFAEASSKIFDRSRAEADKLRGMGTTMVLGFFHKDAVYIGNVGDSRAYLFRKPYFWQLTEDHSLVNEQIRAGLLPEDAPSHILGRNVITRSVGYEREVLVDVVERQCEPGECYLLCSDGLSGLVSDHEMSAILNQYPVEQSTKIFVDLAKARGGDDNISVVLVEITS